MPVFLFRFLDLLEGRKREVWSKDQMHHYRSNLKMCYLRGIAAHRKIFFIT